MTSIGEIRRARTFGVPLRAGQHAVPRGGQPLSDRTIARVTFWLPLLATAYSALFAILNARGLPMSTMLVIAAELAILGVGGGFVLRSGLRRADWVPIALLYMFVIMAIVTSMLTGRLMIEAVRSGLIIAVFSLVGLRMRVATLDRLFLVLTIAVLGVLVFEIVWLAAYVEIFRPQAFFSATRGIAASEYNSTGLFNTASSYEGRFNFGFFSIPRTSSIFLEQISLGNYASIVALFLAVRGRRLAPFALAAHLVTIALILVTTNSRFGSALTLVVLGGYLTFPLLPRALLPMVSIALFVMVTSVVTYYPFAESDDIIGRLSFVGQKFQTVDLGFYLGANADVAVQQRDSGYTYLIGTITIFGMIGLWLYVHLFPRADDAPSRRLIWGLVIYFFGQLLVSSTSLLSIKTAALVWVLVGCVRAQPATVPDRLDRRGAA